MKRNSQGRASLPTNAGSSWAGWLVAAIAWLLHLVVSYGVVEWHCHNMHALSKSTVIWLLHLITAATALAAMGGAWLAYRNLRRLPPSQGKAEYERSRFMAKTGFLISLFFTVVIIVEGLPNLVLEPCPS